MSEVFRAFNQLINQRSKATLAYRPQANGTTERIVQTVMRAVKLYAADPAQRDWDEYADRLVFALNTSYDRVRQDQPFYLLLGWDARTTMETNIPTAGPGAGHARARRWRTKVQSEYQRARERAGQLLQEAMEDRRDAAIANERGDTSGIEPGARVWVFINQVKPGYAKKLAHLWHGPFRVLERPAEHLVKLEVDGTSYRFFPLVHVSRLKLWRDQVERPAADLETPATARLDFDEALLPEDSWEPDERQGHYEVEAILDHRDRRVDRQGRMVREYLVKWLGYDEQSWVTEADLRAPSLLEEYEQFVRSRGRFAVMETEGD